MPPLPAPSQPAPDIYLEALRRLGCTDPGTALVVEDAGGGAGMVGGCEARLLPRQLHFPGPPCIHGHCRATRLAPPSLPPGPRLQSMA